MFQGEDRGKRRKKQLGQIKCFSLSVVEPALQNCWRVLVFRGREDRRAGWDRVCSSRCRGMRLRGGGGEEVSLACIICQTFQK